MIFSWRSDSIRRGSRRIIIIQFTSQVHVNIIEVETHMWYKRSWQFKLVQKNVMNLNHDHVINRLGANIKFEISNERF